MEQHRRTNQAEPVGYSHASSKTFKSLRYFMTKHYSARKTRWVARSKLHLICSISVELLLTSI